MVDVFTHHINTTNVFLLTFNGEDPRMDAAINQMIREMEMLFGYEFWDNVLLEATHWAYTDDAETKRNYTNKTEDWWTEDKNTVLRNKFHLDHDLTAVFIDSYAKQPYNLIDEHQQEMFAREASKLWDFAMNHPPFAFRTIEDVLADLDNCQRTLEGDIADLKADMEEVKKNFTVVEEQFIAVEDDMTKLHLSPIGTIAAWVTKPEQIQLEEATLPEGWVKCDGSVIPVDSPSIWAGSHTPDLNTEKRFLRGGHYSTQLDLEEDLVQDHKHKEDVHSHDTTVHVSSSVEVTDNYRTRYDNKHDNCHSNCANVWGAGELHTNTTTLDADVTVSLNNPTATCGSKEIDTDDTGYRAGDETRPKNMNVQWIMRIF